MNEFEKYMMTKVANIVLKTSGLVPGDQDFLSVASSFLPACMLADGLDSSFGTAYKQSLASDGFEPHVVLDDDGVPDYSQTLQGATPGAYSELVNLEFPRSADDRESQEYICQRSVWNTKVYLVSAPQSEESGALNETSPWETRRDIISTDFAGAMLGGSESHLINVVGTYLGNDGAYHPLRTLSLTSGGLVPRTWNSNPSFNRQRIFLVPAKLGYNWRDKRFRWFGSSLMYVGKNRIEGTSRPARLKHVIDVLREVITDLIGDDTLSTYSLRPLAQTRISLEYRGVKSRSAWADVWPITPTIHVAVALSSHSKKVTRVKNFFNWTSRNSRTGTVIHDGKSRLTAGHLGILLGGGKAAEFMSAGCPEPQVNLTDHRLNALVKQVRKATLDEEVTLFVLEGSLPDTNTLVQRQ